MDRKAEFDVALEIRLKIDTAQVAVVACSRDPRVSYSAFGTRQLGHRSHFSVRRPTW